MGDAENSKVSLLTTRIKSVTLTLTFSIVVSDDGFKVQCSRAKAGVHQHLLTYHIEY